MNNLIGRPVDGDSLDAKAAASIIYIDAGVNPSVSPDELDWYCGHVMRQLSAEFPEAGIDISQGTHLVVEFKGPARQTVYGESYHKDLVQRRLDSIFANCKWDMA